MSSNNSTINPLFTIGPIHVVSTSIILRLFGLILGFFGFNMIVWSVDPHTAFTGAIIFSAIGGFLLLSGLYLNGVQFQKINLE